MAFDPFTLSSAASGLDVFSHIFGGVSGLQHGSDSRAAAEFQAAQLRQNAGQAQAAAQRDAFSVDQQSKLVASRALAVAAASGGGASDPTVVSLMAGIAGEGSYRSALALYQGDEKARAMNSAADTAEYEGKLSEGAARRSAFGKFLGAGAASIKGAARGTSLFEKYGQGGPGTAGWGSDLGTD